MRQPRIVHNSIVHVYPRILRGAGLATRGRRDFSIRLLWCRRRRRVAWRARPRPRELRVALVLRKIALVLFFLRFIVVPVARLSARVHRRGLDLKRFGLLRFYIFPLNFFVAIRILLVYEEITYFCN
jgi:hypothetical protein